MKVVLFCGGLGTRLREHSETIPKPLVNVGYRPIIWHLMRYYAHFGHKDFVLCLGYRGDMIREYFLQLRTSACPTTSRCPMAARRSTCCRATSPTGASLSSTPGMHTNLGQRLMRVREHLEDEEMFLANYSDGLSRSRPARLHRRVPAAGGAMASFVSVRPSQSFHVGAHRRRRVA